MGNPFKKPKAPPPPPPVVIEPVKAPKVEEPPPIPIADDSQLKTAAKKKVADRARRSGRLSTILSQSDSLG